MGNITVNPLSVLLCLIFLKLQCLNLQVQLIHLQGQSHFLWIWETLHEFLAFDHLLTAFRVLLKEKYVMSVLKRLLFQLLGGIVHADKGRTTDSGPRPTQKWWMSRKTRKHLGPPPSSSSEEYNSALRQPPRKPLWEQRLFLLTIQKWDNSTPYPLEK